MNITTDQKQSIKTFCEYNIRKKKIENEFKDKSRKMRDTKKDMKQQLEDMMKRENITHAVANTGTGEKLYLILQKKVNHKRLEASIIGYGVDAFVAECSDVLSGGGESSNFESNKSLIDHAVKRICQHVGDQRRNEKITFSITAKKPPKCAMIPFQDITGMVQPKVAEFSRAESLLKKWQKLKKRHIGVISAEIEKATPTVQNYFSNNNLTSQRVTLKEKSQPRAFYIRQKQTAKKPSLTNKHLQVIVREAVTNTVHSNGVSNISDIVECVAELRQAVLQEVDNIPKTVSTRLTLDKGHYRPVADAIVDTGEDMSENGDTVSSAPASIFDEVDDEEDDEEENPEDEDVGAGMQ